jgi:hypothetical protein
MSYQLTSAILGLFTAGTILWLIRRDHLHSRHALWWLLVAFTIMLLGIFPTIIDWLAIRLGINYPPTLLFILGMGMILVKVINIDLHQSSLERKVRRLAQRQAILEGEKYEKDKNGE